jgi:sporulation protein YlmC with PRC-barrel domain
MTNAIRFMIGADAECADGICGEVSRLVVDPLTRAVTHLLVEPKHRRGLGRLVPLDLVDSTGHRVRLKCTKAQFEELEPGEETRFLPGNSADADYGPGHAVRWPHFSSGIAGGVVGFGVENVPQLVTDDKIPIGEVAIRRGERVRATDGETGRVQGLVVDPADRRVTHIVLAEGRWGRRQVAIPMDIVGPVDHGIRLKITKHDVHQLPPVNIDRGAL